MANQPLQAWLTIMRAKEPSLIEYSAAYGELLVADAVGLERYWELPLELRETAIAVHETRAELNAVLDFKAAQDAELKAKQAQAQGMRR